MPGPRGNYWDDVPLWLKAIVVAVAYLLAAELGNAISVQQSFSAFWPPAGVLLVLLVLTDPREWPLLIVAAASANITSDVVHGRALAVGVGFATANCLEAMLGAGLVRRFVGVPAALVTRRGVLNFVTLAGAAAPALGASIGTVVVSMADGTAPWWRTWATWWSGDALGVLAVGALGLVAAEMERRGREGIPWLERPARAAGFVILLAITGTGGWWASASLGPLVGWKFALFLPAVLTTAMFGPLGAVSTGLVLSVSSVVGLGARWARMPDASTAAGTEVLVLQIFLAVLIFVVLYIAGAVEEAKTSAEAERVAAEKYRVLLETLPTGVTISDAAGGILETSRHAADILGIPTEEHERRSIGAAEWRILGPDGSDLPPEEWTSVRALAEQRLIRQQQGLVRPDGSTVWLDITAAPIPLEGYGVAITYTDITEQLTDRARLIESESRLEEARERLEEEIAERTAELTISNEDLRDALEAKSHFLANMSHELRTPLNSIIGFAGVMEQGLAGPLTDEQRTQLGMIHGSGKHLLQLVNDILDLARIEAGRTSVTPTRFDLCALANEVAAALAPQTGAKGIGLRVGTSPEHVEIVSDRPKVEQVLINLVDNAVKFTENGEVTIECATDGEGVSVVVSDTGIGIPPEDIDRIMDDFNQVDRVDGMKPSGTGLGLPISRRLVAMLGGRFEVESEPGSGSTFRVWLPGLIDDSGAWEE